MTTTLTPAQLTALETASKNDAQALGLHTFALAGDWDNLGRCYNWVRDGVTPYPNNNVIGPSGTITGATNVSNIVITSTAHGRATGDTVVITGVGGNTAANNNTSAATPTPAAWTITVLTVNTFSLNGSVGNGAYTSGGTWTWSVYGQPNLSVQANQVTAAIAYADMPGSGVVTGSPTPDEALRLSMYQTICNQPGGTIPLVNASGVETVIAVNLKKVAGGSGTASFTRLSNLELRFGSYAEAVLGVPGVVVQPGDAQAIIASGNA